MIGAALINSEFMITSLSAKMACSDSIFIGSMIIHVILKPVSTKMSFVIRSSLGSVS